MPDQPATSQLLEILMGPFRAYGVYAAAKLRIPDRLTGDPVRDADLAETLEVDPAALRRLMRMLDTLGVTTAGADDTHRLGPVGSLLTSSAPESLREVAVCYGEQFYPPLRNILHSITTSREGYSLCFGAPLFEHCVNDNTVGDTFDRAMAASSTIFDEVPHRYDFSQARRVIDVGGGDASLLTAVLSVHPHLHGILAEQPRLIDRAHRHLAAHRLTHRTSVAACDMFDAVPAGGDIYLLARVLHDWDDPDCTRILRAVRAAMPHEARLLIVERVVPSAPQEPTLAVDYDLHMLVSTGGRERSRSEYAELLSTAHLHLDTVVGLPQGFALLAAYPEPHRPTLRARRTAGPAAGHAARQCPTNSRLDTS